MGTTAVTTMGSSVTQLNDACRARSVAAARVVSRLGAASASSFVTETTSKDSSLRRLSSPSPRRTHLRFKARWWWREASPSDDAASPASRCRLVPPVPRWFGACGGRCGERSGRPLLRFDQGTGRDAVATSNARAHLLRHHSLPLSPRSATSRFGGRAPRVDADGAADFRSLPRDSLS